MQTILWPLCCTSKAMAELGLGGIGPSPSRSWLSGSARTIAASMAREQMVRTVGTLLHHCLNACAWEVADNYCFNKSVA